MAKKETKKVEETKEESSNEYILVQLKEDRDVICKQANRITALERRIDRIVAALGKSKSVRGL